MTIIDLKCVTRSYAKASRENIDKVAAPFQADPQKMELLSILDEQVELLAKEGRPDLSRFFDSLESHSITPLEEVSSLWAEYGRERVSRYLVWILDTYTNATTGTGSTRLLGYCRRPSRQRDRPRSWQAHAR
jgi:hypothetical protein